MHRWRSIFTLLVYVYSQYVRELQACRFWKHIKRWLKLLNIILTYFNINLSRNKWILNNNYLLLISWHSKKTLKHQSESVMFFAEKSLFNIDYRLYFRTSDVVWHPNVLGNDVDWDIIKPLQKFLFCMTLKTAGMAIGCLRVFFSGISLLTIIGAAIYTHVTENFLAIFQLITIWF